MARPVNDMLRAAAGRLSMHMPGHKGRAPFEASSLYALDTTELPLTDNLHAPRGAIREAEALYARSAGAAAALFLTGGATAGVHTLLQLYAREGDTVLLPRNAHLSAVNACIQGGLVPVWIPLRQTPGGFFCVAQEDVLQALQTHPETKSLLLTRPDYDGVMMPLEGLAAQCAARGCRLLVDEAHGAHLPWLYPDQTALALGAAGSVQSCHKTLPALTGTAVLLLQDAADVPRARLLLRRSQSSSPSYVLVRSIDDARAWMDLRGRQRLSRLTRLADRLRRRAAEAGYPDPREALASAGYTQDPTRLVLRASQGGEALAEALAARGIDVEMAEADRVVCILTAMDTAADLDRLARALADIPPLPRLQAVPPAALPPLPEAALTPRQAAMRLAEAVPFPAAAGRIAAEALGVYPPGIPLAVPGERLTPEILAIMERTLPENRFGTEGDTVLCVV